MAFLGRKWKKQRWILIGYEKFALQKCLYFFSKMHRDQDIRLFIFFSSYPFGGIFTHLKMKKICQNQNFLLIYIHTQLNMRVPKIFKEILLLWHALMLPSPFCDIFSPSIKIVIVQEDSTIKSGVISSHGSATFRCHSTSMG